jgi:hypothetical protein
MEEVVFPQNHVRTVLLGPAGWNEGGRLAGGHRVAKLHPRQFFEEDAARTRLGDGDRRSGDEGKQHETD